MFAPDLFPSDDNPRPDLLCDATFLDKMEHAQLMAWCDEHVAWRDMTVVYAGKEIPIPRRLAWYGEVPYAYSGLRHPAAPMPAPLRQLADRIEAWLARQGCVAGFNSVLMNHYRGGNDSIGMHSDDETQLGSKPVIASVSLGAVRTFVFRHKATGLKLSEPLAPGSLLVMRGRTQELWTHGIPKEPERSGARINLTFRHTNH